MITGLFYCLFTHSTHTFVECIRNNPTFCSLMHFKGAKKKVFLNQQTFFPVLIYQRNYFIGWENVETV